MPLEKKTKPVNTLFIDLIIVGLILLMITVLLKTGFKLSRWDWIGIIVATISILPLFWLRGKKMIKQIRWEEWIVKERDEMLDKGISRADIEEHITGKNRKIKLRNGIVVGLIWVISILILGYMGGESWNQTFLGIWYQYDFWVWSLFFIFFFGFLIWGLTQEGKGKIKRTIYGKI